MHASMHGKSFSWHRTVSTDLNDLLFIQTFQGSEDEIGSFPVIIRTRYFRSPRIGWTHMRLQPRLDLHKIFIQPMFLFSAGEITNVENGTSPMTPIIGHVECNAFDHILYECTRIVLTFKSLVLVILFLFGRLCGRRASTALPPKPESCSSYLLYILPNSVCLPECANISIASVRPCLPPHPLWALPIPPIQVRPSAHSHGY